MEFDSEESLLIAMGNVLPELVETYVKPEGEELLRQNILIYVYGAYSPWVYKRRNSLPGSVISEIIKTGGYSVDYEVSNTASAAPPAIGWVYRKGGMLAMLEEGDMGFWRKGFPRPSISPTQKKFDSGYLSGAIRAGIKALF